MTAEKEVAVIGDNWLIVGARAGSLNQFFVDLHAKQQQALSGANAATPRITKLSPLQKKILLIALRWRGKARSDVYAQDIKTEVFGWKPMSHYSTGWVDEGHYRPGTARLSLDHPSLANQSDSGQIYDRKSIGEQTYNSISVTVWRTLKRLTERHLIYQSGAGWSLTKHGMEVAKTMTAPAPLAGSYRARPGQAA